MSKQKLSNAPALIQFLRDVSIPLSLLIATVATVGSLIFQYVLKFEPCELCWFQRIFMYSQVIVFGSALYYDDRRIWRIGIPLSVIGLAIAIYHYLLQLFPKALPCTSESQLCAQKQLELLGFVSIPFMSAVAFASILVLMIFLRKSRT